MVVCKYFLQGTCRFGDSCKFEHPRERHTGFASQNRYGIFQSPANSDGPGNTARRDSPYGINVADVKNDLTEGKGRPKWLLSTYGPGRSPPASLLEGNEYSSEEIRVRFYELRASGKMDEANQEASNLWAKAEQAMGDVVNNADNVIKFMEDAEKKHPNRLDLTKVDGTKPLDQVIKEAESGNSVAGSSGFGQPSAFTKPATAFGQPPASSGFGSGGFGQPAQPSSFGQPSGTLGQAPTSTFGKPAFGFGQPSFGQSAKPVFGQPAHPNSVFGQPAKAAPMFGQATSPAPLFGQATQSSSAFGKPAFGSTSFGQPSTIGAKNPFAAPSAATGFGQPSFGQPSQAKSIFGQPSQSNPGFGQSSRPSTGLGQPAQSSPFAQPSQASPFSQPTTTSSPFGQTTTTPSPFGQTTTTSSPFGQATTSKASDTASTPAFGKPSTATPTFGQPASQPSNPFATRSENKLADFGNPGSPPMLSPASTSMPNSNSFGVPSPPSATGPITSQAPRNSSASEVAVLTPNANSSATPHPLTNKAPHPLHYTQTLPATAPTVTDPATKKLRTYRGRPVRYIHDNPCYERSDGKGWERIWFPQNGQTPDVVYLGREDKIRDLVAEQERYTDDVIHEFAFLFENGKFKDGKMPAVPPKREWCLYDF